MKYIKLNARITQVILITILLQFLSVAYAFPSGVEPRTALVIGNANYHNGPLFNPVNDARAVADSLKKLGFKVLLRENLSREGMLQSVGEFSNLLKEGGVGMFYYAGHGMQINGKNFLIPVDADIKNEDDIEYRSMDASYVLKRMDDAHVRVNLVVLDACRNNPFARNTRSVSSGLAQMDAPKGTLIAFSTAPNSLANDGLGEKNSVYTRHLVEKLSLPGVLVEQVFKEVRIAVTQETHDKQIPWESSSLTGDFYFVQPSLISKPTAQVVLTENIQTTSPEANTNFVVRQTPVASKSVFAENKPTKRTACASQPTYAPEPVKTSSTCPAPGTVVAFTKAMNPSFMGDYKGCDIVVKVQFLKMGNENYNLPNYDISANTTFQVLNPGSHAQASLGGMSFGTFAGIQKSKSDLLFALKTGDLISLRGAPIELFAGTGMFNATSVIKH